jgi:mRNA-degrading endonuclease RelE of RelBE toxin-antitoxin system
MFEFDVSDELKIVIKKLLKKDKTRVIILNKKIKEIICTDKNSIMRYKNLKYTLSEYKRVHIDKSFVLLFKVDTEKNHILFDKLMHHDNIYR